jgi:hypothetical protein
MKTTVHIDDRKHLQRKTGISGKKHMDNKASQAYHLREFCGGGNSHPNTTLKDIKCHVSVDQRCLSQLEPLISPVSKGDAKAQENRHDGEGVASQQA